MNTPIRGILCGGIWAALLSVSPAQLDLKREPLPVPAAPPKVVPLQIAPQVQGQIIIRQNGGNAVIINGGGGVLNLNGVVINGGNVVIAGGEDGSEPKPEADPAGSQVIDYTDGQRLHGTLSSLDMAKGQMMWQRPDASALLSIPSAQISRWSFENEATVEAKPGATVKFIGSDWLIANVTSIQGDKVNLELPDGTKLTTTRNHIEWIYFSKGAAAETYDGPTGLSGWTTGGTWTYQDGALRAVAPSPISRNFRTLPDQVEYRFVIDQGEILGSFTVSLHSRTFPMRGLTRGMLQISMRANTLNLWASVDGNFKTFQTDLTKELGAPAQRAKGAVLFRVFEDAANGKLVININGHEVAEWTVDKMEPGKNGGIFQIQPTSWNGTKEQTISSIRVLPWDGHKPDDSDERAQDSVTLGNGEIKRGKLSGWDGHALKLATEHGAVTVPGDQMGLVRFQRPENPPDDAGPLAHVRLAGRGEFDAVGLDWRDGKFQVKTNFGGELALAPSTIAELEFNHAAGKAALTQDLLVFRNGDRLRGALEAADETGKLSWRPAPDATPVDFAPTFVAGLQFPSRGVEASGAMVARFRNGDWLGGRFLTLDRQQLVLDAAPVGQPSISREAVKALYFSADGAPAVSDGVSDHETWEGGLDMSGGMNRMLGTSAAGRNPGDLRKKLAEMGGAWTYFAGSYARKTGKAEAAFAQLGGVQLGRLFQTMGQRVELDFTVSAERSPTYFSTQLFTEPSNPGYMLHVSNGALSLYDMNPRPRARGINQQQFPFPKEIDLSARTRHLRLFVDRLTGRLAIFVDGVLTGQLIPKAADGPRNLGRGIMITPQPMANCTISDLWVGPWNGVLPGKTPGADAAPATVALANGDEVEGSVDLATPTTIKVTSEVGALELPVERVSVVEMGGPPVQVSGTGTRLHFAGQGSLTVSTWRIEKETIICRSEIAGELKLPLNAVQEIVFAKPPAPTVPPAVPAALPPDLKVAPAAN